MENLNQALNIVNAYRTKIITIQNVKNCGPSAICTPLAYVMRMMGKDMSIWKDWSALEIATYLLVPPSIPTTARQATIHDKLVGIAENKKLLDYIDLLREHYHLEAHNG